MMEMAVQVRPRPSVTPWPSSLPFSASLKIRADATAATTKSRTARSIQAASSPSVSFRQTADEQSSSRGEPRSIGDGTGGEGKKRASLKRVFFLDVNPLCYEGSAPSLRSFARWISLFFSQVSLSDPVVAVLDGERGSEHRRRLLPSYKAQRRKFSRHVSPLLRSSRSSVERSHRFVINFLKECNVPVIKVEDHEADDVVATLVGQALQKGYQVVIASPDKDFKQLISEDVQIVMPVDELQRWSFYTLKHYIKQYNCDPDSDLSLRCILGDDVDGVPGIQHLVPAFGRKTALKLLKKHGSLENLLNAAAVRTVGKQYAQEALTKYANYLRRNYEVLALRRDVNVFLQEDWLVERNSVGDSKNLSTFVTLLGEMKPYHHNRHHPPKNLTSEEDVEAESCGTSCWQLGTMEDGMFKREIKTEDELGGAIWFRNTLQSNCTYPTKRRITGFLFIPTLAFLMRPVHLSMEEQLVFDRLESRSAVDFIRFK